MRIILVFLMALLLTACGDLDKTVQDAQQAIEAGKQAVEAGQQVIEKGKEIAQSEVAQQLQAYLQQKYDSSEKLRAAMFTGDGQIIAEELKNTELANFDFYTSEMFGVKFAGKLTADGNFQVLKHDLKNPNAEPTLVHEFNVILDQSGQIQVQ
ncbi:hypothetical protein [Brevibacillus sp. SYSU BS000544]|uniref:hypothetical protein n=1 Tax=Brevibacillus sp. SYSU BS000544 TaxID=3416443 RepID=UPI003CE49AB1